MAGSRALTDNYAKRSARRENEREQLRIRCDGQGAIDEIKAIGVSAQAAFMLGDKDCVPALRLQFDTAAARLNKVLPTPRSVELTNMDADGPVLILDMIGEQPYTPPEGMMIVDGDFVELNDTSERSGETAARPDSSSNALFE